MKSKPTSAQIEDGLRTLARHMHASDHGPVFAPLFHRLKRELEAARQDEGIMAEAAAFLKASN